MTIFDITNEILKAQIPLRHSVREYTDKTIEGDTLVTLQAFIEECNKESGLNFQLITDEPLAFSGPLAKYGNFKNVKNYIACVGAKSKDLQEKIGYWGERIVLAAQALGLNTCWVGLTFSKRKTSATVRPGEKLACVISLGFGATQGKSHKIKSANEVSNISKETPEWFAAGVEAALLAPTAMNQQKFMLIYDQETGRVESKSTGGAYSKMDLGIAKCHFELGSGKSFCVRLS